MQCSGSIVVIIVVNGQLIWPLGFKSESVPSQCQHAIGLDDHGIGLNYLHSFVVLHRYQSSQL